MVGGEEKQKDLSAGKETFENDLASTQTQQTKN
jgi:hypothetical protein